MEETVSCAPYRAPLGYRLKSWAAGLRGKLANALFRAAMALVEDGGYIAHARREFLAVGYDPNDKQEGPNKWIQQNLLDLLRVMTLQGHSGFSASYLISAFQRLARFEPMVPLTGADSEWVEVGSETWQNKRCGRVFKDADGRAYDIDGRVFREPDGCCFTSRDSRVYIDFPYTPKTEYVDVPKDRD
jgi:hypothetical protein